MSYDSGRDGYDPTAPRGGELAVDPRAELEGYLHGQRRQLLRQVRDIERRLRMKSKQGCCPECGRTIDLEQARWRRIEQETTATR